MKKLVSLALVLVLVLSLAPAAFADHEHTFGDWVTVISSTETEPGLARRFCTVKDCKEYEELELEKLPICYYSDARDSEKLRAKTIIGCLNNGDTLLHDWICSQMLDLMPLFTDRHFYQAISIKYEGLGVGSFPEENDLTVGLTAAQLEELMAAREGLCLQLTTGHASIVLDAETLAGLGAKESVALNTVRDGDKLTVKLLVDSKSVAVPTTVLTWCKDAGKYMGNADSRLECGGNGISYTLAYTDINTGDELSLCDGEPDGYRFTNYNANWKLRLGEKFVH